MDINMSGMSQCQCMSPYHKLDTVMPVLKRFTELYFISPPCPPGKKKGAPNETQLYKHLSIRAKYLLIGGVKDTILTCFYF